MTAFFLFAGLALFAMVMYEAFHRHARAFLRMLVWVVVLLAGLVWALSRTGGPTLLSTLLVNVWGVALIALPVYWCARWIHQGYKGHE